MGILFDWMSKLLEYQLCADVNVPLIIDNVKHVMFKYAVTPHDSLSNS